MSEVEIEQDAIRRSLDGWFAVDPAFRRSAWMLKDPDTANGHFVRWCTEVDPPPGVPRFDISLHLGYASIFVSGTSVHLGYHSGRLGPEGVAKDKAQSIKRVVGFVDALAEGRVKVRRSSRCPGGYGVFLRGRYGWHLLRRPGRPGWFARLRARLLG